MIEAGRVELPDHDRDTNRTPKSSKYDQILRRVHPGTVFNTQAINRHRRGLLEGLTVTMVGDIQHSRTARSNIWGLKKLGASVIVCGPSTLVSPRWKELGVDYS